MPAAQLRRRIEKRDLRCPYAQPALAGEAVYCGVEAHSVGARQNPATVERFCMAGYTACPTFRAERERRTATPLVEA